jgi:hypothetical protein
LASLDSPSDTYTYTIEVYNNTDNSSTISVILPDGFGSYINNIGSILAGILLPDSFSLPDNFGIDTLDISVMFSNVILDASFVLLAGLGQATNNMDTMLMVLLGQVQILMEKLV